MGLRKDTSTILTRVLAFITMVLGLDIPFGVLVIALIKAIADARLTLGWDREAVIQDRTTMAAP